MSDDAPADIARATRVCGNEGCGLPCAISAGSRPLLTCGAAACVMALRIKRMRETYRGPRGETITAHRLKPEEIRIGAQLQDDYERPKRRGDCLPSGWNEQRPCPFASCKFHIAVDVNEDNGSLHVTFPGVEFEDMKETCALDVADRDDSTLEDVGAYLGLTRERIRQVETVALRKLVQIRGRLSRPDDLALVSLALALDSVRR